MIGGSRTRKKAVGENTSSRFQLAMFPSERTLMNIPMSAPRTTTTMDSGKYWNPVCSIRWMSRIPQATTQRTKKRLKELLCSLSTAPLSGRSALFWVVLATGASVVAVVDLSVSPGISFWVSSGIALFVGSGSGAAAGKMLTTVATGADPVVTIVDVSGMELASGTCPWAIVLLLFLEPTF